MARTNIYFDGCFSPGNLSKKAKDIMMKWLYTHSEHPFPSEEEKKFMAVEGEITMTQVGLLYPFAMTGRG